MTDTYIFEFDAVWKRIRQITGWKRYGEMAAFLGIQAASVSGAKARGAMPIEWAFRVAQSHNTSTDWLLTGADPDLPFDINLLVHVAQVFERVLEGIETKLGWEVKGKLLGKIFKKVKVLGFDPHDKKIEMVVREYLDILEITRTTT